MVETSVASRDSHGRRFFVPITSTWRGLRTANGSSRRWRTKKLGLVVSTGCPPISGEAYPLVLGALYAPVISPDGRALAYLQGGTSVEADFEKVIRQGLTEDWNIAGPPELLFRGPTMTSGIAWAPSGQELIFCNSDETVYYGSSTSQLFRLPARPGGVPRPMGVKGCNTVAVSKPDAQKPARLVYGSSNASKTQLWHA